MDFSNLLKNIREEKNLTQKELADVIFTSPQNIAHYEHKRRTCSVEQAVEILKLLDIDVVIKDGDIRRDVRMCKEYFDKNGNEIKEGMILRHEDGEINMVYKTDCNDLGFNASNKNFIGYNPFTQLLYPLSEFVMKEWEIVDKEKLTKEEWDSLND